MITDAQVDAAIEAHFNALPFHVPFATYLTHHTEKARAETMQVMRRQMRAALEAAEAVKP